MRVNRSPPSGESVIILAVVALGLLVYFVVPKIVFPSGVWVRRVVHEERLTSPVQVTQIKDDMLVSERQQFRLAGIQMPAEPALVARAREFLGQLTKEGVQIVRCVDRANNACLLLCDARIVHTCGNDAVAAHYQRLDLNELMLAAGLAEFDESAGGLTSKERLRLQSAEAVARKEKTGVWRESVESKDNFARWNSCFGGGTDLVRYRNQCQ